MTTLYNLFFYQRIIYKYFVTESVVSTTFPYFISKSFLRRPSFELLKQRQEISIIKWLIPYNFPSVMYIFPFVCYSSVSILNINMKVILVRRKFLLCYFNFLFDQSANKTTCTIFYLLLYLHLFDAWNSNLEKRIDKIRYGIILQIKYVFAVWEESVSRECIIFKTWKIVVVVCLLYFYCSTCYLNVNLIFEFKLNIAYSLSFKLHTLLVLNVNISYEYNALNCKLSNIEYNASFSIFSSTYDFCCGCISFS